MKKLLFAIMFALTIFGASAQTSDTLYLEGSKGKLFTIVQRPSMKKGQKLPVVIICHGFGSNCERPLLTTIAKDVVEQGMIAIRFDFNGCGRSEGEFQDMTVLNEIDDLKHVIDWARQQPWTENISLVGHSQGGVVVSMTSGELGANEIKCEALLAPAAVLRDDAIRGITMGSHFDPWNLEGDFVQLPGNDGRPGLKLGKAYIQSAVSLPIYETARNYTGPTLIVQGTHDQIVSYTYAERYHDVIAGSILKLVPDENHSFTITNDDTSLMVADWLHSRLMK